MWCAGRWNFAKTCSARSQTCVLCSFHRHRSVFQAWRWLRPVRRFWDLLCAKGAFCALFIEIAQFLRFRDDFRPVRRFWGLVCSEVRFCQNLRLCSFYKNRTVFPIWRWFEAKTTILRCGGGKERFCQNVLSTTPNARFVQCWWKSYCFPGLAMIWRQYDDFVI